MKRVFIDLEKCDKCKDCVIQCSYFYHRQNNGITSIRELATFAVFCRKCEEAPCVSSCYHNALKKQDDGILRRARFLCTSCKTCSIACPFGAILPDFLQYLDSQCDFCVGKDNLLCIETCPYKAIALKDIKEEDIKEGIYFVSDRLAVHTTKWLRDDTVLYKKKK
ncbi:4Fe-4S dicluster domain-containing protein [Candidatus Omnitrophota bacterium]